MKQVILIIKGEKKDVMKLIKLPVNAIIYINWRSCLQTLVVHL